MILLLTTDEVEKCIHVEAELVKMVSGAKDNMSF